MATGIAEGFTQSSVVQSLITGSIRTYFCLTYPWTLKQYYYFIDVFYNHPFHDAPMLYFYSHNDPMCYVPAIEDVIKYQKEHGYQVLSHDWPVSAHAQHMMQHPIEYKSSLTQFLMKIDPGNMLLAKSKL